MTLVVRSTEGEGELEVVARNAGSIAIGISRTFGITGRWLFLIRRNADGTVSTGDPEVDSWATPEYVCLEPGQSFSIRTRVPSDTVVINGRLDDLTVYYPGLDADSFSIQAVYEDGADVETSCNSRCACFRGREVSDVVHF